MAIVVSASRRSDIPSFYSEWFYERLKAALSMWRTPTIPDRSGA